MRTENMEQKKCCWCGKDANYSITVVGEKIFCSPQCAEQSTPTWRTENMNQITQEEAIDALVKRQSRFGTTDDSIIFVAACYKENNSDYGYVPYFAHRDQEVLKEFMNRPQTCDPSCRIDDYYITKVYVITENRAGYW